MASGVTDQNGNDLDDVFESGSRSGTSDVADNTGSDLVNRYAHINDGSQASATGIAAGDGNDLNTWFAALGSVSTYDYKLTDNSYSDGNQSGGFSELDMIFSVNGRFSVSRQNNTTLFPTDEYARINGAVDNSIGPDHDIRATLVSGDAPNGGSSLGSWLSLSTERNWSWSIGGANGSIQGTILVEIRESGGSVKVSAELQGTAFSSDLS